MKQRITALFILSFCYQQPAVAQNSSICVSTQFNQCVSHYAALGLLGSGAALQGCVNWVVNNCFSDYDQLVSDVTYFSSEANYWSAQYTAANSLALQCAENYNLLAAEKLMCENILADGGESVSTLLADYNKQKQLIKNQKIKIKSLKKKIKTLSEN